MAVAAERATMSMKVGGTTAVKDWSSYTPVRVRNVEEMEAAAKRREARKVTKKVASTSKGNSVPGKPYVTRSVEQTSTSSASEPQPGGQVSPSSLAPTTTITQPQAQQLEKSKEDSRLTVSDERSAPQKALFTDDGTGPIQQSFSTLDKIDSSIFESSSSGAGKENVEHWKAIARRLKHELTTCQRRFQSEIGLRDQDVKRHQLEAQSLREDNEKLNSKLLEMMKAMDELKREGEAELARCGRENAVASKRAAIVERRLAGHEEDLEKKLRGAALREESLKKERDALACGLAAVAESAVGGKGVTPAVLLKEAEAAISEGADPLPRKRDSWIKFTYSNQISSDSLALRKVGCDGDRAVSSLVSSVDRLHRRRKEAIRSEMEALEQIESLHVVIQRVEREYEGVRSALDILEQSAELLTNPNGPKTVVPTVVNKPNGLSSRIQTLSDTLSKVVNRMQKTDLNTQKLKARVLELEFYGKLHEYIVDEAKSQVAAGNSAKGDEKASRDPDFEQKQKEAVKIQAHFRGMKARRQVSEMRKQKLSMQNDVPS